MRDLFLIVLAATLPIILVRPYIRICAWFFVSLFTPVHLAWCFARDAPFAVAIAVATLPAWLRVADSMPTAQA